MRRGASVAVACLASCAIAPAQEGVWIGARAGAVSNIHRGTLDVVSGSSSCGAFTAGSGVGPMLGLTLDVPLVNDLRLGVRASFANHDGTFAASLDNGMQVYDPATRTTQPLVRRHEFDASMQDAELAIVASDPPFDLPLRVVGGVEVGWPLFRHAFVEREAIVSPAGYLYPTNTASLVDTAAPFDRPTLRLALTAGVEYALPIGHNGALVPHASISYPLTNAVGGQSWKIVALTGGLGVRFGVTPPAPPRSPEPLPAPPPPPPVTPPPAPVAHVTARDTGAIDIVETTVTETYPLLPYVFFAHGGAAIPDRYVRGTAAQRATYRESALPMNSIDIYHRLLDLLGARLRANPAIAATLVGTTDGKDEPAALARARAEAVRRYFMQAWAIDSTRLSIAARVRPDVPTNPGYPEGDEENRRVEIASADRGLFRPVVHAKFTEYRMTPPTMTLDLAGSGEAPIADWSLDASAHGTTLLQRRGGGAPPSQVTWTLPDSAARALEDTDAVLCSLTLRDARGGSATVRTPVPVHKRRNTVEVERLSLVVFEFDRTDIIDANRRMIETFVADALQPGSTVRIVGSTDRLGEAAHNQELSQGRAERVRDILLQARPDAKVVACQGVGMSKLRYDNALPEGRFYCRTVAITVQTPLPPAP